MKGYLVLKLLIKLNWRLSHFTTKTKVKGKCTAASVWFEKIKKLGKSGSEVF